MKAIVKAFFTAVNAVIALFGGEKIDIDAQINDVYGWLEALDFNID